jgi:ferredoxin
MTASDVTAQAMEAPVHTVRVNPDGTRFAAPADRTLLQSALAAGVVIPTSCRNGTCRSCMTMMEEGRVAYRIEWPGLLAEEKTEGWILPCVAYPQSDLAIALPGA